MNSLHPSLSLPHFMSCPFIFLMMMMIALHPYRSILFLLQNISSARLHDRINKWEQTNKKKQNQEWTELLLVWQWHNIREYPKFPKLDKTENWKWAKAGMKRNPSVGTAALAQYPRIAGWFKPRFGKAWILQNFATRSTFCQWRRLSTRELISLHHNLFKSESDWKQKN